MKLHIQTRTSHSKMNLERLIDSKLLSLSSDSPIRQKQQLHHLQQQQQRYKRQHSRTSSLGRNIIDNYNYVSDIISNKYINYANDTGYYSKGGSLKVPSQAPSSSMHKSVSANSNIHKSVATNYSSSQMFPSKSSSTSSSRNCISSSVASSVDSIYHDASNILHEVNDETASDNIELKDSGVVVGGSSSCSSSGPQQAIQICDSVPIATKFIDIVHYSISKDSQCSNSTINFIAKFLLGKRIERQAIRLLEAAFTLKVATFCINSITSSIWDESDDDPPLDLENASLDEAVLNLTKLLESNYANYTFIPKQFLSALISKQVRFYLSQLSSQKRNKFVIYSFFVHLLDELEAVD